MADQPNKKSSKTLTSDREDRLKAALKANMGKRKAQAKVRAAANGVSGAAPKKNEG